jgi:hypothetical protein
MPHLFCLFRLPVLPLLPQPIDWLEEFARSIGGCKDTHPFLPLLDAYYWRDILLFQILLQLSQFRIDFKRVFLLYILISTLAGSMKKDG